MFDDDALRLLAAFAGGANLRRAAQELGVPRSTVSRQLTELEQRLGQAIFLRHGRALAMTALGERLVTNARIARDARTELDAAAQEASAGGRTVVVAVSPLFAEVVLPGVLPAVCERHPGLRVRVALSHGYADIFDERVDVALRRGPLPDSSSLHAKRLGRLTMMCVGTRRWLPTSGSASSASAPLTDAALRALPWVHVGAGLEPTPLAVRVGRRLRNVAIVPRVAVDSQRLALELVRGGLGVAKLNSFLAQAPLASGELVEVLPEARASEAVFAVYPRRARPDPIARDLVSAVVERCRELDIWD